MRTNHVQIVMFEGKDGQSREKSSEGGGGSVSETMPRTFQALENAFKHLSIDHLRHLDKEVGPFILTRIAGLLRLQSYPAVADKRFIRAAAQRGKRGP